MSVINYDDLRSFCYSNDKLIEGDIRGIVIQFYGLGDMRMRGEDSKENIALAEKGIVHLIPYTNPWCWMNSDAVCLADEIIAVIMERYSLPRDTRIVSMGGSMGGLSSLVYCKYAALTPVACVASCPVCDLPYHYTERPDLPRTLYSAFGSAAVGLDAALQAHSPLHLAEGMPDISYTIFHCTADKSVNIDAHSRQMVKKMSQTHRISLTEVPDRGHCDLGEEAGRLYMEAILRAFN